MKTLYLGIKYYADTSNRPRIEAITDRLLSLGYQTTCIARDIERWGAVQLSPQALMDVSFREIERSDLVVLEMSEKGVGLGIEAGYAYAHGIPIVVLIEAGREVSTTLAGIAAHIITYEAYEDIHLPTLC